MLYCIKCETFHGNNYFPLIVPDKNAPSREHVDFANECGCYLCAVAIYNMNNSLSWYLNERHSDKMYNKRFARKNFFYFLEVIRKNNALHVINGCRFENGWATCPPPEFDMDEWMELIWT